VLTGIVDGLFSSVLSVAIGVLMHFGVAFGWSALFLLLVSRSGALRRLLASPRGVIQVAALYGPFIWVVMSPAVIPLLLHRAATINIRWWIQLIGHFPSSDSRSSHPSPSARQESREQEDETDTSTSSGTSWLPGRVQCAHVIKARHEVKRVDVPKTCRSWVRSRRDHDNGNGWGVLSASRTPR
jgi:hypothetical protein